MGPNPVTSVLIGNRQQRETLRSRQCGDGGRLEPSGLQPMKVGSHQKLEGAKNGSTLELLEEAQPC